MSPCSGADRATSLRRPEKSIPQGTLGAVVISFCMYMSYMGLWAAVAQRDYLLGNTGGGDHAMLYVVREVAYPVAILTELGIIIASIAQAMQCIIVSPRLLQVRAHCTIALRSIRSRRVSIGMMALSGC